MRTMLLLCIGLLLAFSAIGCTTTGSGTATDTGAYQTERAAISDFDDCVALQARFDGWFRNRRDFAPGVASSSMIADDEQMHEIGCFKDR